MQSPDSHPERHSDARAQNARLRGVPLPRRLLRRLRSAAAADDEGLDALLCEVRMPPGLDARLRRSIFAAEKVSDETLDEALREVPVPQRLYDRLRRSVLADDEGLDETIREVPIPVEVVAHARQVPKTRIRLARLSRWATAASLAIAIGFSYVGAMLALLVATYPADRPRRPELVSHLSGRMLDDSADREFLTIGSRPEVPQQFVPRDLSTPAIALIPRDRPLVPSFPLLPSPADLLLEAHLFPNDLLGAHDTFDKLSDLKKVAGLIPRGMDVPLLVPGFDLKFWTEYGVHPFVVPALHADLRSTIVPLDIDASSYELTRRHLEDGRLPPADAVRTEEFLAAIDYELPKPKQAALKLSTAGGPSPFGGKGMLLLQVGVQAPGFSDRQHAPAHLVLAVDVSTSMRWEGRLRTIRRAIEAMAQHLDPDDRISLVSFDEGATLLIEDVGPDETDQLIAAVHSLSTRHSTNVGAGLQLAYAVAQHWTQRNRTQRNRTQRNRTQRGPVAARVVLLTDGLAELDRGTADRIEQRMAEAHSRGIRLDVIDLSHEKDPDRQLAGFAASGGGTAHRATNAEQVRSSLLEILTGSSQLVAEQARLKVTFNPKTVLAYRLLGHEAKALAGLMPVHPESDFHCGRSATALYELRLKPGSGGGNDVAVAELTWQEPGHGPTQRRRLTHKIRRGQFAAQFVQAPLALQEAALVAETAEILRNSPFVSAANNSRAAASAKALELAGEVDTRLYERPTFVDFLEVVRQAMGAR